MPASKSPAAARGPGAASSAAPSAPPTPPTPPIGVLDRALSVLECFRADRLRLHLRELAELTGLDKATLLRNLATLARHGYVHRYDDGRYAPGPALLRLGGLYLANFNLAERMQPVLARVMHATQETVAFYIRSGDERVCLYRDNTLREIAHHVEVGKRIPLSAGGSSAHVLLAYTGDDSPHGQAVRERGYWITREERVAELASVAVPVFEGHGGFLGALVVIGLASRHSEADQEAAVALLRQELAAQGFRMEAL